MSNFALSLGTLCHWETQRISHDMRHQHYITAVSKQLTSTVLYVADVKLSVCLPRVSTNVTEQISRRFPGFPGVVDTLLPDRLRLLKSWVSIWRVEHRWLFRIARRTERQWSSSPFSASSFPVVPCHCGMRRAYQVVSAALTMTDANSLIICLMLCYSDRSGN